MFRVAICDDDAGEIAKIEGIVGLCPYWYREYEKNVVFGYFYLTNLSKVPKNRGILQIYAV